jgi:hypothetical protein
MFTHHASGSPADEPIDVRVAYSREKDEKERSGRGEEDWKCDVVKTVGYSSFLSVALT